MTVDGPPRVDAHQHFWKYSREEYGWIDDSMRVIRRDFGPDDLLPHLRSRGIDACVAVQARSDERENEYLVGLARGHAWIAGVVGWLDLRAPSLGEKLDRAREEKRLVGFREVLQGEADERFLNPAFIEGLRLVGSRDFAYDILIYSRQLKAAIELARRALPDQRLVLDHLGKPEIRSGDFAEWARHLRVLARDHQNVCCKLSGMVTEAGGGWSTDTFRPYAETVIEAFGPSRVLYGSDWPVCLLNARDYSAVHDLAAEFVGDLGDEASASIFGGNAARFYRLEI
jgi:L-fuconolactonase